MKHRALSLRSLVVGGFLLTLAISTVPLAQADNGKVPSDHGIDAGFTRDINGILGDGNGLAGRARGQEKGQEHGQTHGNGHALTPALAIALAAFGAARDSALTTFRAANKSALDAYNAVLAPAEATRQTAIAAAKTVFRSAEQAATTDAAKRPRLRGHSPPSKQQLGLLNRR
jgi:hypothetical protein